MEPPQTPQSESEPKRLEYRSPSVTKLGKLADLTLTTALKAVNDNAMGPTDMVSA
jgi:hypothetical protein